MPVWLNTLVKILSEDKSVAGLSFMIIAHTIAKLLSILKTNFDVPEETTPTT